MAEQIRLVRSDEPLTALVDGDTVMFSAKHGAYFGLDEVGTRIWDLLEQPRSLEDVCATLCSEFDVDAATCRRDVSALVEEMRRASLVSDVT
jgi:hypothetical protein